MILRRDSGEKSLIIFDPEESWGILADVSLHVFSLITLKITIR